MRGSLALSENSVVGHGECQQPTGTASSDIDPQGHQMVDNNGIYQAPPASYFLEDPKRYAHDRRDE